MAVVRARSSPPYGLFMAVALAVLCAGAAIVFYVMWAKQSVDLEKAENARAVLASSSDMTNIKPGLMAGVASTDKTTTVLQQADKKIKALEATLAEARASLDKAITERDQQKQDLARANTAARSASERQQAGEKDAQSMSASSQATIASLQDQLKKAQDAVAAASAARDQAVADGETKLSQQQQKMDLAARDNVLALQEAQATIARNELEIRDYKLRLVNSSGGDTKVTVGEPDGKIIRVNGATGNVWITLTKNDRIKEGMTFTAYDPRTGVRFGTDDAALGDGSLEVIEVGEKSSLCRITRITPNRAIQADDVISNLVYHGDKTRKYRFVIFGDFDLDGDGSSTAAERDRLARLIVSWGGEVDNDVTSQTDYLVMGARPATPAMVESADATATASGSVGDERMKQQEQYDALIVSAKRLAIPVLNANRFLAMIGYYNTTVVRY